jgi:hypothetical protein
MKTGCIFETSLRKLFKNLQKTYIMKETWYHYDFVNSSGHIVYQLIQRGKLLKWQIKQKVVKYTAEFGEIIICKLTKIEKS